MATLNVDYKKFDDMNCNVPEEEKLELDFNIDSDGEPPEDEVGDIRNVIRNKNEKIVRKEIMKIGSGLEKPGKPFIITANISGYTKSGFQFLPLLNEIKMTLGDVRLVTGLWKSIEHMKKGEQAKIWIKPGDYGYAREKNAEHIQWPDTVKDSEELKQMLKDEEIYFEVELLDWIVRSDILGDGQLMKTYEIISKGYDRCGDDDEVIIDYTISKLEDGSEEVLIESSTDEHICMRDHRHWSEHYDHKFSNAMGKVLKSMKLDEKSFTVIRYEWLKENDQKVIQKYHLTENSKLKYHIYYKNMVKVEDFYNDGTVFRKVFKKGDGTTSPFSDSTVLLHFRVSLSKLNADEEENVFAQTVEPLKYNLDEYSLPPLIRNILKTLKLKEQIEIQTILKNELIPEFSENTHGMFKPEWVEKVGEIDEKTGTKRWMIITLEMTEFETPESMHALYMIEKLPRLLKMKNIATKFFQMQNWAKACKVYQRIYSHFNLKDIYNNLHHEDETSEDFKSLKVEFDKIKIQTLTNILVVKSKLKDWNDILEMSAKALEIQPDNVKALFFRAKAFLNLSEFEQSIDLFNKVLTLDKDNKEAAKELAVCKKELKKYRDKEKEMYKFK